MYIFCRIWGHWVSLLGNSLSCWVVGSAGTKEKVRSKLALKHQILVE